MVQTGISTRCVSPSETPKPAVMSGPRAAVRLWLPRDGRSLTLRPEGTFRTSTVNLCGPRLRTTVRVRLDCPRCRTYTVSPLLPMPSSRHTGAPASFITRLTRGPRRTPFLLQSQCSNSFSVCIAPRRHNSRDHRPCTSDNCDNDNNPSDHLEKTKAVYNNKTIRDRSSINEEDPRRIEG